MTAVRGKEDLKGGEKIDLSNDGGVIGTGVSFGEGGNTEGLMSKEEKEKAQEKARILRLQTREKDLQKTLTKDRVGKRSLNVDAVSRYTSSSGKPVKNPRREGGDGEGKGEE